LTALIPAFSPQEKENLLESSGCFMRIHQSSRRSIPKRRERFTFSWAGTIQFNFGEGA
jgi:hypothetical protein